MISCSRPRLLRDSVPSRSMIQNIHYTPIGFSVFYETSGRRPLPSMGVPSILCNAQGHVPYCTHHQSSGTNQERSNYLRPLTPQVYVRVNHERAPCAPKVCMERQHLHYRLGAINLLSKEQNEGRCDLCCTTMTRAFALPNQRHSRLGRRSGERRLRAVNSVSKRVLIRRRGLRQVRTE